MSRASRGSGASRALLRRGASRALVRRGAPAGPHASPLGAAALRASLALVLAALLLTAASAARAAEPSWRFVEPQAPPPPAGGTQAPYGVPVGDVGQISFWAPNRGLMITGGTAREGGPVASGLYAYDGVSWHQLSEGCGGAEGRIVWAGPDEFWTVADQRAGQVVVTGTKQAEAAALSLCHFADGQIVGSYAVPLDEPESWVQMTGGACYTPSDCWFGGLKGRPPHVGAFHLHWDGSNVSAVYEPEDHSVFGMVAFEGTLLESVGLEQGDEWLPEEERRHPATIHTIAPGGVEPTFGEYFLYDEADEHDLPVYGEGVLPEALQAFDLATDGAPSGEGVTQLWAAANPAEERPSASSPGSITVLRDHAGSWSQVIPNAKGESPLAVPLESGSPLEEAKLAGSSLFAGVIWGTEEAIAPEPGGEDAWLSLHTKSNDAVVAQLRPDGTLARTDVLPEAADAVGDRGEAGPIVCPAANDCWLATTSEKATEAGWLFHLSGGAPEQPDTDPFFDGADGVLTNRPRDAGLPVIYPYVPPVDDSLANQRAEPPPPPAPSEPAPKPVKVRKAKRLIKAVKSRFLHGRTLVISFMLTARAHVQLIARRGGRVVAKTARESLKRGRHSLSLTLDPHNWPTRLQFEAKPVGSSGSSGATEESSGLGSGNTVST